MNADKHRCLQKVGLFTPLFIMLVGFFVLVQAVSSQDKDPLQGIPQQLRDSLKPQLEQVMLYQRNSNWGELYDLLLPEWQGGTREEYVRKSKEWNGRPRIAKFTPTGLSTEVFTPEGIVDISKLNYWIIVGCGEYGWGWFKEKNLSQVEARWNGDRWSFSEIHMVFESLHGPPAKCPKETKSKKKES